MCEEERQALLSDLLGWVKKCQVRYGGRSELATENEEIVAQLCLSLEVVLSHGQKYSKASSNAVLSDTLGGKMTPLSRPPSIWSFVKGHLNRHEMERYMLLKTITSDVGRFRAWLRATLNEHSLERFMHMLLSDAVALANHFEPWAFLRDEERSSVLPSIAAGLGSILFAVNIDNAALNHDCSSAALSSVEQSFLASAARSATSVKKKRKGRKARVLDFVDDEDSSLEADQSVTPPAYDAISVMQQRTNGGLNGEEKLPLGCSRADAGNGSLAEDEQVSRLTPLKNVDVGALIPLSAARSDSLDIQSEDSASVRSLSDDADYGCALAVEKLDVDLSLKEGSSVSRDELRQALVSVMKRKEELLSQCGRLRKQLEQEKARADSLRDEVKDTKRRACEATVKLDVRIQTLSRENELLKHQLKKYVGAVQKLRDGPQAYETLAQLEGRHPNAEPGASAGSSKYVDYHFEASEFEKKLIQVAEMHGELLEFNEHLQKLLQLKDAQIKRLRDELVDLRGPLPEVPDPDSQHLVECVEGGGEPAPATGFRPLINIWIPSVFLSGNGSKTHHVYQVYLKIGGEEWNIYRRYSEFHSLHRDLQKRDRIVATFDFPPKKTVGYKADKVVEDRRKRLQGYLRCIVNLMVQMNPSLLAKPEKEHVLLLMPFFAETSVLLGHNSVSPSLLNSHQQRPAHLAQPQPRSNRHPSQHHTAGFFQRQVGSAPFVPSIPQLAL